MKYTDSARPILVTGGTGQVGFELLRELCDTGLMLLSPGRSELNLESENSIRSYVQRTNPRLIINAAAYTAVDRAEDEAETAGRVNAEAPGYLAAEAAQIGAPLIHYSTDYVFDGTKIGSYVETDAANPLGVYGRTKLEGEEAVRASTDSWIVLRCSWVYSRRGSNFLKTMLRLGNERAQLSVVDDQYGSPSWARLIARATAMIVRFTEARGTDLAATVAEHAGVYHMAAPDHTTWYGFARAIFDRHPGMRTVVDPIHSWEYVTTARRPGNSVLDSAKIYTTFGVTLPLWKDQLDLCLSTSE